MRCISFKTYSTFVFDTSVYFKPKNPELFGLSVFKPNIKNTRKGFQSARICFISARLYPFRASNIKYLTTSLCKINIFSNQQIHILKQMDFCKFFRAIAGVSPSKFRKKMVSSRKSDEQLKELLKSKNDSNKNK